MNDLNASERDRLLDLLADRATGGLAPEDAAELDALVARWEEDTESEYGAVVAGLLLAGDDAAEGGMPEALRARLESQGAALVGGSGSLSMRAPAARRPWLAMAALVAVCGVGVAILGSLLYQRTRSLESANIQLAQLHDRVESNRELLAAAQARTDSLTGEVAQAAQRETDLVARLAEATDALDGARLAIAQYEQPADPAELMENRQLLAEVPGTVRFEWQPFDLPDAPAEQQDVRGDVVWNDNLQQGYLRFVGLDVNDPNVEQYQVWIIDERGMEQKVSGGVFDVNAEGEVIVPLDPGIDVGRVALFALTVENPGGTWVPDLSRRVVVGPRPEG
ncbi:MAG: hypothetical protein DHS20C14_07060 [Phycisphaeraceae bacterium]|nr:MAG: hypothetical protein DHS20C14_07060 [Phycisphaeraceae bacterium]